MIVNGVSSIGKKIGCQFCLMGLQRTGQIPLQQDRSGEMVLMFQAYTLLRQIFSVPLTVA